MAFDLDTLDTLDTFSTGRADSDLDAFLSGADLDLDPLDLSVDDDPTDDGFEEIA